jgi:hypothetical protein
MNYSSRIAISISILFFSYNLFAATKQGEIDCPPISTIANVKFIKSQLAFPNDKTLWVMISDSFNYFDNEWNVSYLVRLPNASTPNEALYQGQIYFNTKVVLSNPTHPAPPGYLSCEYAHVDDGYNGYLVQANSPAADIGSSKFSKNFK